MSMLSPFGCRDDLGPDGRESAAGCGASRGRFRGMVRGALDGQAGISVSFFFFTAYPRRHETPNLDWNAESRNAEPRFSQLLYH